MTTHGCILNPCPICQPATYYYNAGEQQRQLQVQELAGQISLLTVQLETSEARNAILKKAVEDYAIRVSKAALAASPSAQGGWQPIETAPKDGTVILVYHAHSGKESLYEAIRSQIGGTSDDGIYKCLWGGGFKDHDEAWPDWWCMDEPDEDFQYPLNPTHWQPLPAPPVDSEKGKP